MKAGISPLFRTPLEEGDHIQSLTGCCFQSSLVAFNFTAPSSKPRSALSEFRRSIQAVVEMLEKHGGGVLNTVVENNQLHLTAYVPVELTSASFFVGKLSAQIKAAAVASDSSSSKRRRQKTNKAHAGFAPLRFAVLHHGDIMWRVGVNGGSVPYGSEVDEVAAQYQKLLGLGEDRGGVIYCHLDAVLAQEQVEHSKLISYYEIPGAPGWMEPRDVLTKVVTNVFQMRYVFNTPTTSCPLNQLTHVHILSLQRDGRPGGAADGPRREPRAAAARERGFADRARSPRWFREEHDGEGNRAGRGGAQTAKLGREHVGGRRGQHGDLDNHLREPPLAHGEGEGVWRCGSSGLPSGGVRGGTSNLDQRLPSAQVPRQGGEHE
jgi:hypothetical protein